MEGPKWAARAERAYVLGATAFRARMSRSRSGRECSVRRRLETVVFPLAIPPVKPTTIVPHSSQSSTLPVATEGLTEHIPRKLAGWKKWSPILSLLHSETFCAMVPIASTSQSFTTDPRVHYDQRTNKWAFEQEDGQEFEYNTLTSSWQPVVRYRTSLYIPMKFELDRRNTDSI